MEVFGMENWTTDLKRLLAMLDERRKRSSSVIDLETERKKRAASVRLRNAVDSRPRSADSKGGQESGDDWE